MPLLALVLAVSAALALALAVAGGALVVAMVFFLGFQLAGLPDVREVWRVMALPDGAEREVVLVELMRRDYVWRRDPTNW